MNGETKTACYKETYNALKQRKELGDFRYPAKKKHLDYSCVAGDTLISFSLRSDKDLLKLRAEKHYEDNDDHNDFVRGVAEKHVGFLGTAYDGKGILQTNVPFPNMADADAKQLVIQRTEEFVDVVINELADLSGHYQSKKEETPMSVMAESLSDAFGAPSNPVATEPDIKHEKPDTERETPVTADERPDTEHVMPVTERETPDTEREMPDTADERPVSASAEPETSETVLENISEDPIFSDTSYLDDDEEEPDAPVADEPNEMEGLYGGMERTLDMRKKQLDDRENLMKQQRQVIESDRQQISKEWQKIESAKEEIAESKEKSKKDWESYTNAKKRLDERISAAAKKDNANAKRESELNKREEDIKLKESSLDAEEKVLKERQGTLNELTEFYDRKAIEHAKKDKDFQAREEDLNMKEKHVSIQMEQVQMERKTIENRITDLKEAQELYAEMKKHGLVDQSDEIESLKKKIQSAKQHISDIQTSAKAHVDEENRAKAALKEAQSQIAALGTKNVQLMKQLETAENEKGFTDSEFNAMQNRLTAAENRAVEAEMKKGKRVEELENEVKRLENIIKDSERAPVIEELAQGGYTVQPITGEGDPLLTFKLNGCEVIINERLSVVCVEKKVRRNHTKTFDGWNSQSFAETYCMSAGKAYCRFVYSNIIADIERVVARLNTLK